MLRVVVALILCATGYPLAILLSGTAGAPGGAAIVGTFTLGATVLVGVPLFAWFLRRAWLAAWHAVVAGAFAGAVFAVPWALEGNFIAARRFGMLFLAVGALHGLVFWLLAVYRNKTVLAMSARYASRQARNETAASQETPSK